MQNRDSILQRIELQEVIELTRRLVALPSENPPGGEQVVVHALADYLSVAGLEIKSIPGLPGRPNLIAVLQGQEPGPTLLYTGHSDTMPISGNWSQDPHGGTVEEGKLYGRGAADMKGGLAAMAVALKTLAFAALPLRGSLLFAVAFDEEGKGLGTEQFVRDGLQADWAVIGEPTENIPVIVSNGQINFEFIFHGRAGHGSTPSEGRNAIYDAVLFIQALRKLMETEFMHRSHPLLGHPSFNLGTIEGGIQTSIIPDRCRVTADRRVLPMETVDSAISEVRNLLDDLCKATPGMAAEMNIFYRVEPHTIPVDSPVVQALRWASMQIGGRDPGVAGMRGTTDAACLSNKANIPTVVMGPGSIRQAHQVDEFVFVDQLATAARVYTLTALQLLKPLGKDK